MHTSNLVSRKQRTDSIHSSNKVMSNKVKSNKEHSAFCVHAVMQSMEQGP